MPELATPGLTPDEWRVLQGTMRRLADETKGSAEASFDFTGLPSDYALLLIVWTGRSAAVANDDSLALRLNNDSGSNYDRQRRETATSSTISETQNQAGTSALCGVLAAASSTAGFAGGGEILIPNYAGTTFHKIIRAKAFSRSTATAENSLSDTGAIWKNTAAVDRITLFPAAGNWITGSRCTVYGL